MEMKMFEIAGMTFFGLVALTGLIIMAIGFLQD